MFQVQLLDGVVRTGISWHILTSFRPPKTCAILWPAVAGHRWATQWLLCQASTGTAEGLQGTTGLGGAFGVIMCHQTCLNVAVVNHQNHQCWIVLIIRYGVQNPKSYCSTYLGSIMIHKLGFFFDQPVWWNDKGSLNTAHLDTVGKSWRTMERIKHDQTWLAVKSPQVNDNEWGLMGNITYEWWLQTICNGLIGGKMRHDETMLRLMTNPAFAGLGWT